MKDLLSIVSHFQMQGTVREIKPLGSGLINDTYKVTTVEADAPDYVLQRINHAIFQNVEMLQSNIEAVTGHIRKKLEEKGEADVERKVLHFIPTAEGKTYWYDGENYWRIMTFIPRAKTYETVNPEYSYYAGTAFGNFQAMLADIPDTLGETIPDFHNMEFRLKQLRDAVAANAAGRVAEVQYFLDEIEKRADGHLAVCNHESAESQHNHGEHGEQYGEHRKESRFGIVELQISFIEIAADRIEAAEFFIFF